MALPDAYIRRRMGSEDAHYGGNLVAGATMLEIFGDLITELAIKQDGDEGLFRAYESVEFLARAETTITRGRSLSSSSWRASNTLQPSITGIMMSRSMSCGRCSRSTWSAASPFRALSVR